MTTFVSNRRRFLQLAGTGTAASVAGCNGLDLADQESPDDENTTDSSTDGSGASTITASVQPSDEDIAELEQRNQNLTQQAQAGEINQSEYGAAVEELQADQTELYREASSEFEDYVAEADALTIRESSPEMGLFLLEAPAEALVGALDDGAVASLLPESTYDESGQQTSA